MMKYCVDIREEETFNTVNTVLETEDHDKAWELVNEYNKEYGRGIELLKQYPKNKYFIDVFEDELSR